MDSPNSVRSLNEDQQPRLKFLCSFNGSILPRPQDGKLRYVGGETRIVSVPRDISFDELMVKMKELFDGVSVLKYQQPDEDLDALVSVVNDDDVTNMMEEYEKLGSGDGFTRLRIFLFSSIEQDDSIHFVDRDERDNERRYVDALNSHNDSPDFGKSPTGLDDQLIEQYYNQLSLDGNAPNHRNFDIPMLPGNLQHVRIPHQQSFSQRYSEMESPWSPAYYSPRHYGNDFPNSPSSSRYHSPYGDQIDKGFDRVPPEDYFRQQNVSHQPQYDQPSALPDNVVWLPPTPNSGDKAGFPGNILHGSGSHHVANPCAECPPRPYYNAPRFSDHYVVDGNGINVNLGHTLYPDGGHVASHYVHHDERTRYIRHGPDFGNEFINDQAVATGYPNAYGAENLYHAPSSGHVPANALWRNGQSPPMHGHPSYEPSGAPLQENGAYNLGYIRTTMESSPRLPVGVENQNQQHIPNDPVQYVPAPAQFMPDPIQFTPSPVHITPEPIHFTPEAVQLSPEAGQMSPDFPNSIIPIDPVVKADPTPTLVDVRVPPETTFSTEVRNNSSSRKDGLCREKMDSPIGDMNSGQDNATAPENKKIAVGGLGLVPQPLESLKKSELEGAEEVKVLAQENAASAAGIDAQVKEDAVQELDAVDAPADLELDSDSDTLTNTKIEPTKAEEEAISRGLQTIRNDDLEEVRELGSGTYGAVYHGKWKGSDVAIKRIKASCFAGRPSERERLIADFWKEALILSSLHHPNVVSFYGIVRDGPDGSLATVTEFMVNGSLKQFLQKKDRTIDRRKRLIIAMDASFGMEYLHGKNIVHFDLKCENLLVNMRDPHRPICKIGDLGLSKVKQHTLVSGGVRGTLPWMAPELLSGKSHMVSEKIDVYSFGIVMWELLTGDEPYRDMHCASIIGGIVNNSLRPTIPTWCDPEWKALMGSCWSADPAERPSFSEISQKLRTMAAAINVK
ncbi:uncharacterized protein [Rutidosis leptorrhynchoides]|uniref:uncharacterized protein n=1 Tax=Rutidosis leptorrhynchoides TaxID=125765 RepID=UPI003A9A5334